jgi:hypothetical protein
MHQACQRGAPPEHRVGQVALDRQNMDAVLGRVLNVT